MGLVCFQGTSAAGSPVTDTTVTPLASSLSRSAISPAGKAAHVVDQYLPERWGLPRGFRHHFVEPAPGAWGLEIDPDRFQPAPPGKFVKCLHLDFQGVVRVSRQCPGI